MSYTPGPWFVCEDTRGCKSVRSTSGFLSFTPSVGHYGDPTRYLNEKEEMEANAYLIAAAPDLCEALRELLEHIDAHCVTEGDCNQARAALAKAVKS